MTVPWQQVGSWIINLLSLAAFGALAYLAIRLQRRLLAAIQKHVNFDAPLERNGRVLELLSELRAETAADRAYVFQFHNGDRFLNGDSRLRMSCTCESVSNGVSREQQNAQEILVDTVPEAVKFLTVEDPRKEAKIQYTKDIAEGYYRAVLETQGIKVTAKYPLYKNAAIIGFFGVDFVRDGTVNVDVDRIKSFGPRLEMSVNRSKMRGGILRLLLWSLWK